MTAVCERVVVAAEPADQLDICALIDDLNTHLLSLYRREECHHLSIAELSGDDVVLLVARETDDGGGTVVGCGALRLIGDGEGEVKRMYVVPSRQGRGYGRLILEAIEAEARRRGLAALLLETGDKQAAALRLYRSAGFALRGPYLDYPETAISIFMEKRLA